MSRGLHPDPDEPRDAVFDGARALGRRIAPAVQAARWWRWSLRAIYSRVRGGLRYGIAEAARRPRSVLERDRAA